VKLLHDAQAVAAVIFPSYSQGPIKGWVNKLKFVKRSINERGRFDPLNQRVLT